VARTPAAELNGHSGERVRNQRGVDFGPKGPIAVSKAFDGNALGSGVDVFEEYGRTGLRHWGGFLFEEWLQQLQQDRRAAEVFREMVDQDPIIGGIDYAIQGLIRRVSWWCEPAKSPQAERLWGMLNDMLYSWADTLGSFCSYLRYGYDIEEVCYKKRDGYLRDPAMSSQFSDGYVGLAKFATRSQDSNWKWVFDDVGETVGYIQNPPPDYLLRFIPREKYLHLRTNTFKDDPSGRSIYRTAYRSFYMARNLQNIEGIGMERDLCGLPVLTAPEGADIWDTNDPDFAPVLAQAKAAVSSIRRDEQEGIILPNGWTLALLASGGNRQLDISGAIRRYQWDMATSVLADLIMMGQTQVGSYALSVTKKDLFTAQLGSFLDIISNGINTQVVPRLWALNGWDMTNLPKLCHGQVETIDLDTLGNFIFRLGASGAPIDWETSLPWMNDQAGIPQPPPGYDYSPRVVGRGSSQGSQNGSGQPGAGLGPHSDTAAASTLTATTPVGKSAQTLAEIWAQKDFQ
jgi:hypothetical protein